MSKTVSHEMHYEAPIEAVAAMLADPAFREAVCRAQNATSTSATIEKRADGTHVRIEQSQPAEGIPSFARKIAGSSIDIIQEEHWTTPEQGTVTVTIPGKPGDMVGTARLAASGEGTIETVELTVTASIPLIGGKIEGLIADKLVRALKSEHRVGREYLAG
ncbi:DUF2505 domain-containing protein [Nocardioides sp. R-C-SC26]|uniref:DUF2505 domain-containing protein n=1 Tax=Nocardioides sp. R-C-SC26 TaxID=2870414 RepID=UPI001E2B514A|nr:DUF2505 domain-containing protein [Nocardioides sp. R-C-SC26]